MSYFKGFTPWLTAFAVTICTYNFLGYDDKGILLYITSPPAWYTNGYSPFLRRFISFEELKVIGYILNVGFWLSIGLIIDSLRKFNFSSPKEKRNINIRLATIAIVLVMSVVIFKVFYSYQTNEKAIAQVISNYTEHSSEEIRYCIILAARQEYGKRYIKEMELIVKETNNPEVYAIAMMALSELKEREALEIVIQNYGRFSRRYNNPINLEINHQIILSMLSTDESPDHIRLAVKAARVLKHIEYVKPLENIAFTIKDDELRQEVLEVISEIEKDPIPRNPKWDVD